ncbi:MAG: 2-hydroxyacid dehydrogenase [Thermodesulfobacteriota bacterium]
MKKIVSMAPLPKEFIVHILQSSGIHDVEVTDASAWSAEKIQQAVVDADIIVGDFTFRNNITADIVRAARNVKLIQQPSAGYQHIDLEACARMGIRVANCPGANSVAVAEHTVMCGLGLLKKILAANRSTQQGEWKQLEIRPAELGGKTWGIVGMGRIGRAVAQRLKPFGVNLIYYSRTRLTIQEEKELGAAHRVLAELFAVADVISLHCPLTDETRNMINATTLASLKPTAVLINVGRGELVDEQALADALQKGGIAGAALDVFSEEPIRPGNPFLNSPHPNLILTPHIAGVSNEAQLRIIHMTMANIARALRGERPENLLTG